MYVHALLTSNAVATAILMYCTATQFHQVCTRMYIHVCVYIQHVYTYIYMYIHMHMYMYMSEKLWIPKKTADKTQQDQTCVCTCPLPPEETLVHSGSGKVYCPCRILFFIPGEMGAPPVL